MSILSSLKGRHWLVNQDFSPEELRAVIQFCIDLKRLAKKGVETPLLKGKHLAMIFEQPSTRTRMSFEIGMSEMGGDALYLRPGEIHLGGKESIGDTAQVISRYAHAIQARLHHHSDLVELAKYAKVPVINGLTDLYHPTQALADVMTMVEQSGRWDGLKVTFLGDATNVCNSLVIICSKLGINLTVANPRKYRVKAEIQEMGRFNSAHSGAPRTDCSASWTRADMN